MQALMVLVLAVGFGYTTVNGAAGLSLCTLTGHWGLYSKGIYF